jgi:hypothetical protein
MREHPNYNLPERTDKADAAARTKKEKQSNKNRRATRPGELKNYRQHSGKTDQSAITGRQASELKHSEGFPNGTKNTGLCKAYKIFF